MLRMLLEEVVVKILMTNRSKNRQNVELIEISKLGQRLVRNSSIKLLNSRSHKETLAFMVPLSVQMSFFNLQNHALLTSQNPISLYSVSMISKSPGSKE